MDKKLNNWGISGIYNALENYGLQLEEKIQEAPFIRVCKELTANKLSGNLCAVIVLCRFYRAEAMELIVDDKSQPAGREILEDHCHFAKPNEV